MIQFKNLGVMSQVLSDTLMLWFLQRCSLFLIRALLAHTSRQGVNTLILVLCGIELALSQSSTPISTLGPFSIIDDNDNDYFRGEAIDW